MRSVPRATDLSVSHHLAGSPARRSGQGELILDIYWSQLKFERLLWVHEEKSAVGWADLYIVQGRVAGDFVW